MKVLLVYRALAETISQLKKKILKPDLSGLVVSLVVCGVDVLHGVLRMEGDGHSAGCNCGLGEIFKGKF